MPFLIYYYIREKKFGVCYFFLTFFTIYLMYIPGFIMGRSLWESIKIYWNQTSEYQNMWCNFPSIWALLGNQYEFLKNFALLLTISILGLGLFYSIYINIQFSSPFTFLFVLIWTVWTCLLFLPSMHERYSYILDLLLIYLLFIKRKGYIHYIVIILCSIMTYGNYLFGLGVEIRYLAIVYTISYIDYTYHLFTIEIKE